LVEEVSRLHSIQAVAQILLAAFRQIYSGRKAKHKDLENHVVYSKMDGFGQGGCGRLRYQHH
jgi:hypothetical protein